MNKIEEEILNLRNELRAHNYNYYVLDNATISDYDFDIKLKVLQDLEAKYPGFKRSGKKLLKKRASTEK